MLVAVGKERNGVVLQPEAQWNVELGPQKSQTTRNLRVQVAPCEAWEQRKNRVL